MIKNNNIAIRIAGKVSRYIDASMNRAAPKNQTDDIRTSKVQWDRGLGRHGLQISVMTTLFWKTTTEKNIKTVPFSKTTLEKCYIYNHASLNRRVSVNLSRDVISRAFHSFFTAQFGIIFAATNIVRGALPLYVISQWKALEAA